MFSKSGSELYSDYPNLVDGYKGKGASIIRKGETGVIEAAGNIAKAQGTISFWYKPEAGGTLDRDYGLVSSGFMGKQNKNTMLIWLWDFRGGKLRFDVDPKVYKAVDCQGWEAGTRVHIACVWDHKQGIRIYVDGELKGRKDATWGVTRTKEIKIGLMVDRNGTQIAGGVFDEFIIYDRPLSDAQVKADYQGKLKARNAPVERIIAKEKKKNPHVQAELRPGARVRHGGRASGSG